VRARTLVGVGLVALAGCHAPVTEVVVVIDTDLSTPAEADMLEVEITSSQSTTNQTFAVSRDMDAGVISRGNLPTFPATIGVVPGASGVAPFSITATLLRANAETNLEEIVVARKATDVQFVQGQTRTLVLTLLRACACKGTNCPNPSTTPPCGDLVSPTLTPFDPQHIPHVTLSDGGAPVDSGADARRDVAAEATTLPDADADHAVDAGEDAPRDVARDRAAEVEPDASRADAGPEAPTRFALGHTCVAASQCQDGFCVDGVCCESKCACGTCGAAGKCAPAAAGTDPRGACGTYTCDGMGACVTTCPQTYGACVSPCKAGAFCDGAGTCQMAMGMPGSFCVIGTCTCTAGLSCHPPDAGGAGVCM
jgi:hypothetical protein